MALKDLIIQTKTIQISKDNAVTLRGLNTTDIMVLANEYEDVIRMLFDDVDFKDEIAASKTIITRAPALACLAIALGAEEPESADVVAQLPIPNQVELLYALYELTFPNGKDDVKKLTIALSQLLKN